MGDDSKRPDAIGQRKPMALDVTVPETYAESHIGSTATKPSLSSVG